jgi:hypothetical protein
MSHCDECKWCEIRTQDTVCHFPLVLPKAVEAQRFPMPLQNSEPCPTFEPRRFTAPKARSARVSSPGPILQVTPELPKGANHG